MEYENLNDEEVLSRLVIRLYQTPIRGKDTPDERNYAYKIDYEGTCSVLALDFEDHFEIMHRCKLQERGICEDAAFLQAKQNILQEPAEVRKIGFEIKFDGFEMWQVKADFFAAAQLIDLPENFPALVGKHGALVAIPSSSLGLVVPIDEFKHEAVSALAVRLFDLSYEVYSEAEHPIIYNVYWWKDNEFYLVPIEPTTGPLMLSFPQHLQSIWMGQVEEAERHIKEKRIGRGKASDSRFRSHAEFLSVHTNVHTRRVVIFRRDMYGNVLDIQDSFDLEL